MKKKKKPIITKHSLLFLFSTETSLCAATVTEACTHHRISFKGELTDQLKGMWTATIYSRQCLPGWPQLKRVSLSQVTLFLGAGCSLSEVRPVILTQISDMPVGYPHSSAPCRVGKVVLALPCNLTSSFVKFDSFPPSFHRC